MKPDLATDASREAVGLDKAWLARRFELFERVCLGSVARQTEGDFQWLVFMDWATPVAFKEKMASLAVHHEFLRPIYCTEFLQETVLEEIRRRETPGRVRITTRLDGDDAIHPRMMERIQMKAREHMAGMNMAQGFVVSFPVGCCETRGDFYLVHEPANPFMSVVSSPECSRISLEMPPGAVDGPVVHRIGRPMWCQVIHGDNRSAGLRGVYWPWGGNSEFAPGISNGFRRSPLWQAAEVVRSAVAYFRHRRRSP